MKQNVVHTVEPLFKPITVEPLFKPITVAIIRPHTGSNPPNHHLFIKSRVGPPLYKV